MSVLRELRAMKRRYLTCAYVFPLVFLTVLMFVLYRLWAPQSFSAFQRSPDIQNNAKSFQDAQPDLSEHRQLPDVIIKDKHVDGGDAVNLNEIKDKLPVPDVSDSKNFDEDLHVMFLFTKAKSNVNLQDKFRVAVGSLLKYASVPLHLHILGDSDSQKIATEIIDKERENLNVVLKIISDDIDAIAKQLHDIVKDMQQYFSYKPGAYYSDALFFISIALHKVMPETMNKAILLDVDIKFQADIKELYQHFSHFSDENLIGIGREMQPVYKHNMWKYRQENPNTRVGMPPPDGLTGFNSGVLLLNLEKIRKSKLYDSLIQPETVKNLAEKYHFKGHLGDQDFFTLLSFDNEKLFYILPCTWNRQLCQWWKDKGYQDIFHSYYDCSGDVKIYHGNCNTPIPYIL